MSHLVTVDLLIKDLDALEAACVEMGTLVFRRGKRDYNWFGRSVGDYPLPVGFTKADLGKCDHAISVKGNEDAYEVGVVKYKPGTMKEVKLTDGTTQLVDVGGTYALLYDFWADGHGLVPAIGGRDAGKLLQEYATQVAIKQCKRQGMQVMRQQSADGKVRLVAKATR